MMKALYSRLCIPVSILFALLFSSAAWGQANSSARTLAAKNKNPGSLPQANEKDPRLTNAYRFEQGGWVYVHLEGPPANVGYQHGYLLAPEIADAFNAIKFQDTHRTQKSWEFFRKTAHEILWPKIDAEYQKELRGIAEGLKARGIQMDVDDIVALNAFEEVPDYYLPWLNKREHALNAPPLKSPGNCSAFVATGTVVGAAHVGAGPDALIGPPFPLAVGVEADRDNRWLFSQDSHGRNEQQGERP